MKKITKATFKSFIKKNEGHLKIMSVGDFSGYTDCVEYVPSDQRTFVNLERETEYFRLEHSLGYKGIYLVGHSRDHFRHYEDNDFIGINVFNCCGNFTIAIQKQRIAA